MAELLRRILPGVLVEGGQPKPSMRLGPASRNAAHQRTGGSCGDRDDTGTGLRAGAAGGRAEAAQLMLRRRLRSVAFRVAMSLAICCCLAASWSTFCRTAIKIALISWESEVIAGAIGEVLSGVVSAATVISWESDLVAGAIGEVVSGMVSAATVFSSESEVLTGAIDEVISGVICTATVSGANQPSRGWELAIISLVASP